jgi:hypothetical protein
LNDTAVATFQQTADSTSGQRALRIVNIDKVPMKYRGQLLALN